MLSNWILSFYNLNKWKIILPHTHTKLTFFFFSLLYLVLRNKLLLTTFSNNYGGVMLGYPDKRTSLPSLLVASKVSTAPSNTSFFFFFFGCVLTWYWVAVFWGNLFHKLMIVLLATSLSVQGYSSWYIMIQWTVYV